MPKVKFDHILKFNHFLNYQLENILNNYLFIYVPTTCKFSPPLKSATGCSSFFFICDLTLQFTVSLRFNYTENTM